MIKKIIYCIFIFVGVGLFLFYIFQERFFFLNGKKIPKNVAYNFPQSFTEVNLITKDNETINALHFKLEKSKGVILFFHGNKGNLRRWGNIVSYLLEYEYEVFVIDYRNYGKSTGSFNELKMYDDALLAYSHLTTKFSEDKIVVYGRSLGATFAAKVASENNPMHLILEAPFYNLKKATQFYFVLSPTFLIKYPFRTDLLIDKVASPVTFFHGDQDKTTSFDHSKELFKLVNSQQKEFVSIPTATHHNVKDYKIYTSKMKSILE